MVKSRTYIATPPGATIREQLEDRDMSQKEFAIRMDLSEKHVSKLIHGEVALTPDVAERLELVLGVPAKLWNNLEIIYREKILKANAENHMEQDIANSHFLRTAGPHFPDSPGHIKRTAWDISRAEGSPPY